MNQLEHKPAAVADRRRFLKLAAAGTVTGGAAVVAGTADAAPALPATADDGLYRESEHVKRYYELARF